MFQSIKSISVPANQINEDSLGFSDTFLFVIDGATSLGKTELNENETDASRFANEIGKYLMQNLNNTSKLIQQILCDAVKAYSQKYQSPSRIASYPSPSASISVFRKNTACIEYYGLGDCTANVCFKNGNVKTIHDEKLTGLDQMVLKKMTEIAEQNGMKVSDARKMVEALLIDNRCKMNTIEGYWVLDPSGEGIPQGMNLFFNSSEVKSVSLMTDGFASICSTYHFSDDDSALHRRMSCENLNDMVKELFRVQDGDPDFELYPRFKHRDDTTAIFAVISD